MELKLTIGKVATAAGVNVETIRFYQRRGLLSEPPKTDGGFRYYERSTISRVRFVKRAQALGFSLDEIAGLLDLQESSACEPTHAAAIHKLSLVDERITDLKRIRARLKTLIQQCETGTSASGCPIIESLGADR